MLPLQDRTVLLVSPSGWPLPAFRFGVEALGGRVDRFLLSYSMARPDWSDFGRSNGRRNQELRDWLRNAEDKPALAIFVTYDDCLEVDTLRLFRRMGVPTVCYHVDMVGQWYRILRTGRHFALVACAQKINIASLRRYGINAEYVPMAACPQDVPQPATVERVVCYTGTAQPYRLWVLSRLQPLFPICCYGMWFQEEVERKHRAVHFVPDPTLVERRRGAIARCAKTAFDMPYVVPILRQSPYVLVDRFRGARRPFPIVSRDQLASCWRGSVAQDRIAEPFAASVLNIGFTYFRGTPGTSTEMRQCRLREFEGPLYSSNGAYLMQRFPELDDLYKRDEEVVAWDTFDELVSRINELLTNDALSRRIGERGRRAVLDRHLWSHRVLEILSHLRAA